MEEKVYREKLSSLPGSRWNHVIRAVNGKIPKEEVEPNEVESKLYDEMMAEADKYEKRGGVRPVFDTVEIETDDPKLDIYSKPVE